jgi:hypothetical protein
MDDAPHEEGANNFSDPFEESIDNRKQNKIEVATVKPLEHNHSNDVTNLNRKPTNYATLLNVSPNATPDRVFKIVFIGDSGVGKTSFVQRFCHNNFRESFNTTIGDFHFLFK